MKKFFVHIGLFLTIGCPLVQAEVAPPETALDQKVDSIFVIASSAELKYRDQVEPAKDSIAALGPEVVPRLVELYKSNTARERHSVDDILKRIGSAAVPYLRQSLTLDDFRQVSRVCYSLGTIGDSSAVPDLISIAGHEDWQVRSNCITALGEIGDTSANDVVILLLSDSVETVRKSAAVAAGRLETKGAIAKLVSMLGDYFYGPRMAASDALVKIGHDAIKPIVDSLNSENELVGDLGCTTLGEIGGEAAAFGAAEQLESKNPFRRARAVEAIYKSDSPLACGLVELIAETEKDRLVLFYIEKTLNKYASR